jgi:PadR family transcriptional regulator, regulatory protein PadR
MLVLRVLQNGPTHGYAIAQRIHAVSSDQLQVEEGSLYPALQRILVKGWAQADWGTSETGRRVRFYRMTAAGRKQLEAEISGYERMSAAIRSVLRTA